MIVLFFYLNVFPFYKNRNLGRMFLGLRIEFLFFVVRIIIAIITLYLFNINVFFNFNEITIYFIYMKHVYNILILTNSFLLLFTSRIITTRFNKNFFLLLIGCF